MEDYKAPVQALLGGRCPQSTPNSRLSENLYELAGAPRDPEPTNRCLSRCSFVSRSCGATRCARAPALDPTATSAEAG